MRILERLLAGWQHISQLHRVITNLRYLISHVGDHVAAGVLGANVDLFGQLRPCNQQSAESGTNAYRHADSDSQDQRLQAHADHIAARRPGGVSPLSAGGLCRCHRSIDSGQARHWAAAPAGRRVRLSDAQIAKYHKAARKHRAVMLLNLQPGRSEFITEAKAFQKCSKNPMSASP
jgi:hypothetical protein